MREKNKLIKVGGRDLVILWKVCIRQRTVKDVKDDSLDFNRKGDGTNHVRYSLIHNLDNVKTELLIFLILSR